MSRRNTTITALAICTVIAVVIGFAVGRPDDKAATNTQRQANSNVTEKDADTNEATSTEKQLFYLIEEEKLAYDVYTKQGEKWNSNIFVNIARSEVTHQDRVLPLLQSRSISDPRSTEIGVFSNPELQELYNNLLAKGLRSQKDAYEVGVAIEEKDINDLTNMLANATATDMIATLEDLRRASENHLRAFNAQL